MKPSTSTLTTDETNPTQHAMVIVWGHFARTIGLLAQLAQVPIAQKAVLRAPYEKLVELLLGLLTGIEYLTDLIGLWTTVIGPDRFQRSGAP